MVLLNVCRAEEMSKKQPRDEWTILYNAVRDVCKKFGHEDPYGHGDYWVVDDNWGGVSQKIVVATPNFLKKNWYLIYLKLLEKIIYLVLK
jgi:hypothetical protein